MHRKSIAALAAMLPVLVALPVSGAALPEPVPQICASRIYDFLRVPVTRFGIVSQRSELVANDAYARYQTDLAMAAAALGYDASGAAFTLHETLSSFPFLNYGRVLSLVLVLCATGHERQNDCRRGEYYVDDGMLDPDRLTLILSDILNAPAKAIVAACDFGLGDWPAVE